MPSLSQAGYASRCRVQSLIGASMLLLGLASSGGAQSIDVTPPTIQIAAPTTTGPTTQVTVHWCDPYQSGSIKPGSLVASSRSVTVNGVNVTSQMTYTLASQAGCDAAATSTGTLGMNLGSNTVAASISDVRGNVGSASVSVLRQDPATFRFEPAVSRMGVPELYHDPALCAADCFEKSFSYSTPAYVSRDVARSLTLVYRSGRAHPMSQIAVAVTDTTPTKPVKYSLKVARQDNGALVTFLSGATELFYAYAPGAELSAAWDASTQPTGMTIYNIIVTSTWADGATRSTTVPYLALVVNEQSSPYGAGVGIAGVQRMTFTTGGVVIADGDGSATYFSGTCSPYTTCSYTATLGDFTTLGTNGQGNFIRRSPDGTERWFTADGRQLYLKDRFGNTTTTVTETDGRVTQVIDPVGQAITIGYRAATDQSGWKPGSLDHITTPDGRSAAFGVGMVNTLSVWANVGGVYYASVWYDANQRMIELHDRGAGIWNFNYETDGTLASILTPSTNFGDGINQRATTLIAAPYRAQLTEIHNGAGTASAPIAVTAGPSLRGVITDPRGVSSYVTTNSFGEPLAVTDAAGHVAQTIYTTAGQVSSIYAPGRASVTYSWSGPDMTSASSAGATVNYTYEPVYHQTTHVWGSVPEQWMTYDTTVASRPLLTTSQRAAMDSVTHYVVAADGRVLTVTDPAGHVRTWTYETSGLMNTIAYQGGMGSSDPVTTLGRDALGRVTSTTDPAGGVTTTSYDAFNRVLAAIGPRHDTTTFTYDSLSRVTQVVDARHQQYGFTFNAVGLLLTKTDPTGASEQFGYDLAGNDTTHVNRRGERVNVAYDSLGRMTRRTQVASGETTTFAYDPSLSWVAASNAASTDTISADWRGLVVSAVTWRSGWSRALRYSYDGQQRRTGFNLLRNGVATDSVAYAYNSMGALSSIVNPLGNQTTLHYTAEGAPDSVRFASGLAMSMYFSATHALLGANFNISAVNTALGRSYVRDSLGRVTTWRDEQGFGKTYAYDPAGELTSRTDYHTGTYGQCFWNPRYGMSCTWVPGGTVIDSTRTYAYDAVGNPADPGIAVAEANRLTHVGGDSLEYDAEGQLSHRFRIGSPWTFEQWYVQNSLGQIVQVSTTRNGSTVTVYFAYDGFGRRVRKDNNATGVTTQYAWDGDQMIAELDANGNTAQFYTYYPGVDHLHSVATGGTTYYAASELGDNVTGLVRASDNAVLAQYAYQPFGSLGRNDQTVPNNLRWQGLQYDAETGLYYVRARYYDPSLGRFITQDPTGLDGGINPYMFAGNDPVNYSDPSGLSVLPTIVVTDSWNYDWGWADIQSFFSNLRQSGGGSGLGVFGGGQHGGGGGTASAGPATGPGSRKPLVTGDCAVKATQFGISLGIETVTLAATAGGLGSVAKATYKYAASWSPSIIRELGITFGSMVQKRLANAAGASVILANPAFFGTDGVLSNWLADINSPASEGPDLRNLIPFYSTKKKWDESSAACQ